MSKDHTTRGLPAGTRRLHWFLAGSILFLFASSWWMLSLPLPSAEFTYREFPFQLHKNIGLTVLVVILVMIAIRLKTRRAATAEARTRLEKLAELEHLLTYFLIGVCCLSGYLSSSYSGWTTTFWWLLDFPAWSEENDELNMLFSEFHLWSCWALLAAILLHIGATLYHAAIDDGVIDKMFSSKN